MYAGSLLRSASELHRRVDALLSLPVLARGARTWEHVDAIRTTLMDVAELLAASAPLPVVTDSVDEPYAAAVEALYGDSSGANEDSPGSNAEQGSETTDEPGSGTHDEPWQGSDVTDVKGVAAVGDSVVLHLDRRPGRWTAVLAALHGSVSALSEKVSSVSGRLRADGLSGDAPLRFTWRSTSEWVSTLEAQLGSLLSYGSFVDRQNQADESERYKVIALEFTRND